MIPLKSIRTAPAILLALGLAGCSEVKIWPFDGAKAAPQSRALANATEYQCEGSKRFYVRMVDNGAAAWLIYPDHEVSLAKASATSGTRYSNGVAVLELNGGEATLKDGTVSYTGCKMPVAGK